MEPRQYYSKISECPGFVKNRTRSDPTRTGMDRDKSKKTFCRSPITRSSIINQLSRVMGLEPQ